MTDDYETANKRALLNWLKTTDLRADQHTNMAFRITTNAGPHGTEATWTEFLREPREREKHLFVGGPVSPDDEAEKLQAMTGPQRHEKANERGGKQ